MNFFAFLAHIDYCLYQGFVSVSYNVCMKGTVELVGDPIEGSCYALENHLQNLKRIVRKPTEILQHIFRKIIGDTIKVSTNLEQPKLLGGNKFESSVLYRHKYIYLLILDQLQICTTAIVDMKVVINKENRHIVE